MTDTTIIVLGAAFITTVVVLGWVLHTSIRSNTMNFGTATRHMERRYRQSDDFLLRVAEKEACDPAVAAQVHANERNAQSSRDAGVDHAEIDAAADMGEKSDSELLGGAGSVDE
jgi:hypothetical protein